MMLNQHHIDSMPLPLIFTIDCGCKHNVDSYS